MDAHAHVTMHMSYSKGYRSDQWYYALVGAEAARVERQPRVDCADSRIGIQRSRKDVVLGGDAEESEQDDPG